MRTHHMDAQHLTSSAVNAVLATVASFGGVVVSFVHDVQIIVQFMATVLSLVGAIYAIRVSRKALSQHKREREEGLPIPALSKKPEDKP